MMPDTIRTYRIIEPPTPKKKRCVSELFIDLIVAVMVVMLVGLVTVVLCG
jgi:hypothetical protein